jgi:predicted DNA-binding transcriptional regulator YafY
MANTKHSTAREIIIDRLLHKRCGYSIYDMVDIVNEALAFEGFSPVTVSTIRRDIETFRYHYRVKLEKKKRGYQTYLRYEDPNFSLYKNVLTFAEIQQIRTALMCIRLKDEILGTMMYEQLSKHLADILNIDHAEQPVVIFEKVCSQNDIKKYTTIYDCIIKKLPTVLEIKKSDGTMQKMVVHPYFLYQKSSNWHLLGHDSTNNVPVQIPIRAIKKITLTSEVEFIPNKDFPLNKYYEDIKNRVGVDH